MSKNEYLSVGKFVGSRGLNGELKVECWMDNIQDFCELKQLFIKKNNQEILTNVLLPYIPVPHDRYQRAMVRHIVLTLPAHKSIPN